jgi:cytochrome c oxidase subunit II
MRWSVTGRGVSAVRLAAYLVAAAAAVSFAFDVRAIRAVSGAERSHVSVRVIRRASWWELQYEREGVTFITANELHVPEGLAVSLRGSELPPMSIEGAAWLPPIDGVARFVMGRAGNHEAKFVRLWPPALRRLRIVAEPRAQFERWFRNEAQPAAASAGGALFTSAGCAYCHTIRGVAAQASIIAPDLTHFAARATIGGVSIPNRSGYVSGWIAGSRGLKRDSQMPDNRLDPRVLHALVAYVETLR